jgi:hypothetical protein
MLAREDAQFVKDEMADPAQVARDGYHALMRGDDHVVTPFLKRVSTTVAKLVFDSWTVQRVE